MQEFIKEAGGSDIRCFVIGDKVVASMKRTGKEGEFRSNLHRGGSAELVRITPEERSTAVRSAKIMGLNVAGVDLLRSNHGPVVMEVNSSPGLEGIETCTELDIAGAIIDYIAAQVDFPEIDVRQRLTVSKGYGVSEIYVPEGSKFIGQTIIETRLAESDINVLTLYRGAKIIPNPRGDRVLEPGDKLLCFGKLEAMRGMIPARTRRKRRPVVQELDTALTDEN